MFRSFASRIRRHRSARGQSVVEFALIIPILLTLTGAAIDVARVYGAWVAIDGATRDAAEQVATDATITTQAAAEARARSIVCSQLVNSPGFVAPPGNPTNCSVPSVITTRSSSTATPGTTKNPLVTVSVVTTLPFRTLFAYPLFTQNGAWNIGSSQTYAILQGR